MGPDISCPRSIEAWGGGQRETQRDSELEMGSHRDGGPEGDTEIVSEREVVITPPGYWGALHLFLGLGRRCRLAKPPPWEVIGSLESGLERWRGQEVGGAEEVGWRRNLKGQMPTPTACPCHIPQPAQVSTGSVPHKLPVASATVNAFCLLDVVLSFSSSFHPLTT